MAMATASDTPSSPDLVEQAHALRRALAALEGAMSAPEKQRYDAVSPMASHGLSGVGGADQLLPMIIVLPPEGTFETCGQCGHRRVRT